jgi:hypothetical protein
MDNIDIAGDNAARLITTINETFGPGWPELLAHPDQAHIAIHNDTGDVALYCPEDGVLHLRPSDGQLMFTRVRAACGIADPCRMGVSHPRFASIARASVVIWRTAFGRREGRGVRENEPATRSLATSV